MKKIEIDISEEDFSSEREYEAFVNGEYGWGWQFNVDRHIWRYGSDGVDGEKWIGITQVLGLQAVEIKDGRAILYYEDEE